MNKNAARYAGINEKKNVILSRAIAGALAGFGAGLFYLSGGGEWNPLNSTSLPAMGFNCLLYTSKSFADVVTERGLVDSLVSTGAVTTELIVQYVRAMQNLSLIHI